MAQTATGYVELLVLPAGSVLPSDAAVPPARGRTAADLQTLARQAGQALVSAGVPFQAAVDLDWASRHLRAADVGRTIVGRLGTGQVDRQLEVVFGQTWDALELTAMSLGFGDTMSAMDLCADAVLLACHEPQQDSGRCYDLGQLQTRVRQARRPLIAPLMLRTWIDQLLAHPDLAELQACRNHLTHRTPRRLITLVLDYRGMPTGRELAEITTLHGADPARPRGSIAELVPRLVAFGEERLESLCRAIMSQTPP